MLAPRRLDRAGGSGRLMQAELTERTEAAYTATTLGDLVPITADLPAVSGAAAALTRPTAGADPRVGRRRHGRRST
jgi:hypothetical protein